jgi:hypothetical protein
MLQIARIKNDDGNIEYVHLDFLGIPTIEPFRSRHLKLMKETGVLNCVTYELLPLWMIPVLMADGALFLKYSN